MKNFSRLRAWLRFRNANNANILIIIWLKVNFDRILIWIKYLDISNNKVWRIVEDNSFLLGHFFAKKELILIDSISQETTLCVVNFSPILKHSACRYRYRHKRYTTSTCPLCKLSFFFHNTSFFCYLNSFFFFKCRYMQYNDSFCAVIFFLLTEIEQP